MPGSLEAVDGRAAPLFTAATEAADAGRLKEGRRGFLRVLEPGPDFPDALRPLSTVEVFLEIPDTALLYAERAPRRRALQRSGRV